MQGHTLRQLRAANAAVHKTRTDGPARPAGDPAQGDAASGGETGHIQGEGLLTAPKARAGGTDPAAGGKTAAADPVYVLVPQYLPLWGYPWCDVEAGWWESSAQE